MIRKMVATAFLASGAVALTVGTAAPAQAAGSFKSCYNVYARISMPGHAGGICDGTGPDFTYRAFANCKNGSTAYGQSRWAGDRRGSGATCPSGVTASSGGVKVYRLGSLYTTITKVAN